VLNVVEGESRVTIVKHVALAAFLSLLVGAARAQLAPPGSGWHYLRMPDEISGKIYSSAEALSVRPLSLPFPYNAAENYGHLHIRDHPSGGGRNVILQVNAGQIDCISRCTLDVRMDGGPAKKYIGLHPVGGRSDAVFLDPARRFLADAKKARRIYVRVLFYRHGYEVIEFTPAADLLWPVPASVPLTRK
jgi:hypothetical protein